MISSFLNAFQTACTHLCVSVCVCVQEVVFAAVNHRHGTNTKVILFTASHCSKYHEMREKHKVKLCRTKQRFEEEMAWRNEKISSLERELSLCSHSLAKVNLQRCLAWLKRKHKTAFSCLPGIYCGSVARCITEAFEGCNLQLRTHHWCFCLWVRANWVDPHICVECKY